MSQHETVFLVDDEPGMLKALGRLLRAEGFKVQPFASAAAFLAALLPPCCACLVLDVFMPGMDGLELQRRLTAGGSPLPVIFLTGHGDIPMSVRAIKAGAVDFLTKPVQAADLLQAVRAALAQAAGQAAELKTTSELRTKLARLTPREREVMEHIIAGKQNKEIAAELGTGEQTIKIHRTRLMQKLELKTVAGLVQLAARLGVHPGGRT